MPGKIFINYRRDQSLDKAQLLAGVLEAALLEGETDRGLRRKIVDLARIGISEHLDDAAEIVEVGRMQPQFFMEA